MRSFKIILLATVILGIGYNAYHWLDGLTQNRIGYLFFKILKNEKVAFQFFKKSAEKGNSKGALNLGHSYYCGHGTQRDMKKARLWLLKSSLPEAQELIKQTYTKDYACLSERAKTTKQNKIKNYEESLKVGDPAAQCFVGVCYLFGIYGKPIDYDAGYKLIQSSADAGNKDGKAALGWCYFLGAGVMQDDKKAFEIFEENAKKGVATAEAGLGFCYMLGRGVSQNDKEAFVWTKKAAEHGEPKAQWNLGVLYMKGKGIPKNTNEGLIWLEKGAVHASASDQRKLGYDYEYSNEVFPQNLERAAHWYQQAADKGNCCGLYSLGLCYIYGKGVQQSYEKGFNLLKEAKDKNCEYAACYLRENYYGPELVGKASAGDSDAQLKLGGCFLEGLGVEKNPKEGFQWIKRAADQENKNALNVIGILYENGTGTAKNGKMAVDSLKKASDRGNISAQNRLGYIYLKGELVKKNIYESIKYFDLAAKAGDLNAKNNLAWVYATSKNAALRNGNLALALSKEVIAKEKNPQAYHFGTLAAAYAESGQFSQATETQEKAISLLKSDDKKKNYFQALKTYQERMAWRDNE